MSQTPDDKKRLAHNKRMKDRYVTKKREKNDANIKFVRDNFGQDIDLLGIDPVKDSNGKVKSKLFEAIQKFMLKQEPK